MLNWRLFVSLEQADPDRDSGTESDDELAIGKRETRTVNALFLSLSLSLAPTELRAHEISVLFTGEKWPWTHANEQRSTLAARALSLT